MMEPPTGIIPEELILPYRRREVVAWLITQPFPGHYKRDLLLGWGRTVNVKLTEREVQQVIDSGHGETH